MRSTTVAMVGAFLSMAMMFVVKTFADTVFLAEYGIEYVPHFFVAQSASLVATSFGYTALIRRNATAISDLTIIAALLAVCAGAPLALDRGGPWVFVLSLLLITLSGLAGIAVWNLITSIVSGRRARAFLPRAAAAQTAGAIIGSFGSSGVVAVIGVDALGHVAAALALGILVAHFALLDARPPATGSRSERKRGGGVQHSSKRLVQLLIAASVVEAVLAAVIDFGFKRELSASLERDQMGVFFALFYGASNVLILLLQLFVTARLLAARSLRFTLSLQPLALAGIAVAWVFAPVLAVAAVARGSEGVLKFGIGRPSEEIAMTPLSERFRQRSKVLMRGVFSQVGSAAAGFGLIAATPLLLDGPELVPVTAAALALVWLLLKRATAQRYLDSLGSALGMRKLSMKSEREDMRLDHDGLAKVIELAGDDDPDVAAFGRQILASSVSDTSVLANHLAQPKRSVRVALYDLLTRYPSLQCAPALRTAVLAERSGRALQTGLNALAMLGDSAAVSSCNKLVAGSAPDECDDDQRAAWAYLAQVGALDHHEKTLRTALSALLPTNGVRAATLYADALRRERLRDETVDRAIIRAMSSDDNKARRHAYNAAATLGRSKPLVELLKAIEANEYGAAESVAHLDAPGLGRVVMLINARSVSPVMKARLLRGLRGSALPDVGEVAVRALTDEDATVRNVAAHTLLRHCREHASEVPTETIERALSAELDRFERYVRARPGYSRDARESAVGFRYDVAPDLELSTGSGGTDAFFLNELERQTERALSRLCTLLALMGNPATVFIAERELRAPTLERRNKAVDILQEVARGPMRTRLFELLDMFLKPPRGDRREAQERVCELDPWLARCASAELRPLRRRMWALRSSPLFDEVPGEALVELAQDVTVAELDAGAVLFEQGSDSDAMYIVMSGVVSIAGNGVDAKVGAGSSFGELALIDGKPHAETVTVSKPSRVLRLDRTPFRKALAQLPEIRIGLVRALARWLREARPVDRSIEESVRDTMVG